MNSKIGKIENIIQTSPFGGVALMVVSGVEVPIDAAFGLRQLASAFGSLSNAVGKTISYETDSVGVMSSFTIEEDDDKDADKAEADAMARADREQISILNGGEV